MKLIQKTLVAAATALLTTLPALVDVNWTASDHRGYQPETGVLLVVNNGDWTLAN